MVERMNQKKTAKRKGNFAFILLFTLSSFVFFRPLFLVSDNNPVPKYIYFVLLLWVTFSSLNSMFFKRPYQFSFPVKLLLLGIVASIISATTFRGQALFDSILAAEYPVLGYIFYFYLIERKVKITILEKVIIWAGLAFIVTFLISFLAYPTHLFQYNETLEDRGFQRILLTGSGFLFLFTFYALNRVLTKRTLKWMVILMVCYLCVILSLTRIYILSTAAISIFFIWKKQGAFIKLVLISLLYGAVIFISQLSFTQKLLSKTQDDTEDIQNYIRFQSALYYTTEFQISPATMVLGNGFGYGDKTEYGRKLGQLQSQGFYVEDLGFLGLYVYMGVFAILAYVLIFYKSFKAKLPPEYLYLKMFIIFLFLNGLTSSATFGESTILAIALTLYLFDAVNKTGGLAVAVTKNGEDLGQIPEFIIS
jgi:hypothetical protein